MPMKIMKTPFERLIVVPFVLNVSATSGTAANTLVEEIGERKLQNESKATIIIFR